MKNVCMNEVLDDVRPIIPKELEKSAFGLERKLPRIDDRRLRNRPAGDRCVRLEMMNLIRN